MSRMHNKVIIVTGAAGGIGSAIARRMIEEGGKVILTDLQDSAGEALATKLGENAYFLHHDVTSADDWRQVIEETEQHFGTVTTLVNNAGISSAQGPIETIDDDDFRRVIEINLTSVYLGMKAALASLKNSAGASIVNISSLAGIIGTPNTLAYGASKFGVRGLSKSAALEFSEFGIRVNSVHPGYVNTPMIADLIPADQVKEFKKTCTPLGRMGEPIDIANLVLFLASDESSYITGSEYIADGGHSAG